MFEACRSIADFLQLWLERDLLPEPEQYTLWEYYAGYRRHFPPRLQHYYCRQLDDVMHLIGRQPGARVLEIGCGTGTESLWMAMNGAVVDAVELSQERFLTANARKRVLDHDLGRLVTCRFLNHTVLDLNATQRYDILWMEQAFHHLEPREAVVDKLVSLIEPGGHVVVSEANALNPLLQAKVIRERGFKTVRHFEDHTGRRHPYGDERILSARSLARLFARRGVSRQSIDYFRLFPNDPRFDDLLYIEQKTPRWLSPLFTHYNYVGRKEAAARPGTAP